MKETSACSAAIYGDIKELNTLLKRGGDLNEQDFEGNTPLLMASFFGQLKTVQWLVKNGANITQTNNEGNTAILLAAQNGHLKVVKWLSDNGGNLSDKNKEGNSIELLAAASGRLKILQWKLKRHEKSTGVTTCLMQNNQGIEGSALGLAAAEGHLSLVKWLIEKTSQPRNYQITAFYLASRKGHIEIIKWLLKHLPFASSDTQPIIEAAGNGKLEALKFLWEHAPCAGALNPALLIAYANGHADTVQWLQSKGAKKEEAPPDAGSFISKTPPAASNTSSKSQSTLILSQAALSPPAQSKPKSNRGFSKQGIEDTEYFMTDTPPAIEKYSNAAVPRVTSSYAPRTTLINPSKSGKNAALFQNIKASGAKNERLVTRDSGRLPPALVTPYTEGNNAAFFQSMSASSPSKDHFSPRDRSYSQEKQPYPSSFRRPPEKKQEPNFIPAKQYLPTRDAQGNTPLIIAAYEGRLDDLKNLLRQGASLHEKNNSEQNAFLMAAYAGQIETAQWLFEKGEAQVFRDMNGNTALLLAAENGKSHMMHWLLCNGSSLTERDIHGDTAIMLAAMEGHIACAQWLLQLGMNINDRSNYGNTALHLAAMKGKIEMAEWLLQNGANLDEENNKRETPLEAARQKGKNEMVAFLESYSERQMRRTTFTQSKKSSYNPRFHRATIPDSDLLHAARKGQLEKVQLMFKSGANLKARDEKGNTVLLRAVKSGNTQLVHWLLNNGANPNLRNRKGDNAFTLAKRYGEVQMANLIASEPVREDPTNYSTTETDEYSNRSYNWFAGDMDPSPQYGAPVNSDDYDSNIGSNNNAYAPPTFESAPSYTEAGSYPSNAYASSTFEPSPTDEESSPPVQRQEFRHVTAAPTGRMFFSAITEPTRPFIPQAPQPVYETPPIYYYPSHPGMAGSAKG